MRETPSWYEIVGNENTGQFDARALAPMGRLTLSATDLREMLTAIASAERAWVEQQIPRQPGTQFVWNDETYITMRTSDAAPAFAASLDTMGALFALHVRTGRIVRWEIPTETQRTQPFQWVEGTLGRNHVGIP